MKPILEVRNLTKSFSDFEAIHDFSLELRAGEVVGILGPNGAGKTTIFRSIVGLVYADSGLISIAGQQLHKNLAGALSKIGCLIEIPAFYDYLSARENLELISKLRNSKTSIDFLLEKVGLLERANDAVKKFSQGMRQRLGIAAALTGDPHILILDEPGNGLDPAGIAEMRELIKSLARESNKAILISSHMLTEIEKICDRILILNEGQIVASGNASDMILPEDDSLEKLFLRLTQ